MEKEFTLKSELVRDDVDRQMVYLVRRFTDLSDGDVTTQKSRLSEARAVAKELVSAYQHNTIVDTVLCLDGTQVIGTCLANELTKDGFANMNAHHRFYLTCWAAGPTRSSL